MPFPSAKSILLRKVYICRNVTCLGFMGLKPDSHLLTNLDHPLPYPLIRRPMSWFPLFWLMTVMAMHAFLISQFLSKFLNLPLALLAISNVFHCTTRCLLLPLDLHQHVNGLYTHSTMFTLFHLFAQEICPSILFFQLILTPKAVISSKNSRTVNAS